MVLHTVGYLLNVAKRKWSAAFVMRSGVVASAKVRYHAIREAKKG